MSAALIFDLDDTLFDHAAAMARFLQHEYALSGAQQRRVLEASRRGKVPPEVLCAAIAEHVDQSPEAIWTHVQHHFGRFAELTAPEVLDAARERFTLGLLTNGGERTQTTKIDALALQRWFEPGRLVISAVIDAWKPDPAAFEAVLVACGATAERSVYVGDDPVHDIGGARGAGLRTCWVARGRTFPDTPAPDWTIDSIADLPSVWDQFPT